MVSAEILELKNRKSTNQVVSNYGLPHNKKLKLEQISDDSDSKEASSVFDFVGNKLKIQQENGLGYQSVKNRNEKDGLKSQM